jgi:ABC-type antimicrobial peptide transport system permease subunit
MILKEALALTAAGVAAGILGALALTRLLSTLLFGIAPNDPATFILVSFLLLAVSVSAACLPARRAARIDPMIALRHD